MAIVYVAVSAFENSIRELISGILLEAKGEAWWTMAVPEKVRKLSEKRLEDEKKTKWHTQRGLDPINYTTMGGLLSIIRNNWQEFEPHIQSVEWAANVFDAIERSRNVIMHSGVLEREDIERLGIYIRDWVKQVGTESCRLLLLFASCADNWDIILIRINIVICHGQCRDQYEDQRRPHVSRCGAYADRGAPTFHVN